LAGNAELAPEPASAISAAAVASGNDCTNDAVTNSPRSLLEPGAVVLSLRHATATAAVQTIRDTRFIIAD